MSIVSTFETQCRALTSSPSPDDGASRFFVGSLNPRTNLLYLFEYKDDNEDLAKVSFKFPFGEIWHLSSSNKSSRLLAGCIGSQGHLSIGVFKLPSELENSLDDDCGLSDSEIEKVFEPVRGKKNLVRQSHWHPEDGRRLLTCNDGILQFWDIEEQKSAQTYSLHSNKSENYNDSIESGKSHKKSQITDLRWSSLFNCSVVAAVTDNEIYGLDTRVPDTSSSSICWLIQDARCNRIRSIDFNPNSQYYVASGGDDCRANFWDLRKTSAPTLTMQPHTHWIWSIRYNPFHDQLVLTAGGDARVSLLRAQSVASEPFGHILDMNDEDTDSDDEDYLDIGQVKTEKQISAPDSDVLEKSSDMLPRDTKSCVDELINVYQEHDDAVYATEWATDPWIFASLGFESRLIINKVPKTEKLDILF